MEYHDPSENYRLSDDIAHEHATQEIDLETIDMASLITIAIFVAAIGLVLWVMGKP